MSLAYAPGEDSANRLVLDAPGNHPDGEYPYVCQLCVSWPYRPGFFDSPSPTDIPENNKEKLALIHQFAQTWAEPFRSLALSIPQDADLKPLAPQDFPPPLDMHSTGRAVLMGDSIHAMAMCKSDTH